MSHQRRELRYYLQAVNNGWDTPQCEHDKADQLAREILADSTATEREKLTARLVMEALARRVPISELHTTTAIVVSKHSTHSPAHDAQTR